MGTLNCIPSNSRCPIKLYIRSGLVCVWLSNFEIESESVKNHMLKRQNDQIIIYFYFFVIIFYM